jgi:hypothetical protein
VTPLLVRLFSALLLAAAVVLVVAWRRRGAVLHEEASLRLIAVLYLIPALLWLTMNVIARRDAARIILELRGVGVRTEVNGSVASAVGGAKEATPKVAASDIWIGGLPAAMGRRRALAGTIAYEAGDAEQTGRVNILPARPEETSGLIGTSSGIVGAQPVLDGDDVCVRGRCWRYDASGSQFTSGSDTVSLPQRMTKVPGFESLLIELRWSRRAAPSQHTYSVDQLVGKAGAAVDRGIPEYLRSFLFYCDRSVWSPKLCLAVLDPDIAVRHDGQPVFRPTRAAPVKDGERITFYSLPDPAGHFEGGGWIDRRSALIRTGHRSYAVEFDTPEVHSLDIDEFRALHLTNYVSRERPSVALSIGAAELPDRSLFLSSVGQAAAWESIGVIDLPSAFPPGTDGVFRFISAHGESDFRPGQTIWAGLHDLTAFRLYVARPSILLALFFLILQIAKIRIAATAGITVAQALVGGAVELLAGIRMEMGYRVWAMPPHERAGVQLGIFCLVVPAWIYLAAIMPEASRRASRQWTNWRENPRLGVQAGCIFSTVWSFRIFEGPRRWIFVLMPLLALLPYRRLSAAVVRVTRERVARMPALLPFQWAARGRREIAARPWIVAAIVAAGAVMVTLSFVRGTTPLAVPVATAIAGVLAVLSVVFFQRLARGEDVVRARIVSAAAALTAARLLLVALGFKESLSIGGLRIALSIIYVPLCVVLEGFLCVWWWQRLHARRRIEFLDLLVVGAVVGLIWLIPAFVTNDNGLALVNLPPLVALIAVESELLRVRRRFASNVPGRVRFLNRAPLIAAILIAAFALVPIARFVVHFLPVSEERLVSLAAEANFARLLHSATPERLQQVATRKGEDLAVTSAVLQRYINTGLLGYGFGRSDVSPQLGRTALREYAPAVFVAAEWGLFGTLALLLIHGVLAGVGLQFQPWESAARDSRVQTLWAIAGLAVLTLGGASIYMILANFELVLFTGRNVYLFGLDSAADILESVVLLWIFGLATGAAREGSVRWG